MDNVQPGKIADRRVFFKGSRIWSCTRCGRNKSRGWQEPRNQDNSSRAIKKKMDLLISSSPRHSFGPAFPAVVPRLGLQVTVYRIINI
jgi:hypothetical protein